MEQVNGLQAVAEEKVSGLIGGQGQDIHAAALAVEQASLAFDLMLQVRNKVVGAYQEISRLQF
jgi:flagellar hook-basal body complex protein FliE